MGLKSKILLVFGLVILCLVVAVIAAHYEFPYDKVAGLAVNRVETSSAFKLEMDDPKPGLPFRITVPHLKFGVEESSGILWIVALEKLQVKLKLLELMSGGIGVDLKARAFGGVVSGEGLYGIFGERLYSFQLTRIDFPDFSLTRLGDPASVSGHMRGTISFSGKGKKQPDIGSGKLTMGPGRVSGRIIAGIPQIDMAYETVTLNFDLKGNKLNISEFGFKSKELQISMSGVITNPADPILNLSGTTGIGGSGKTGLRMDFTLKGPMRNPKLRITGPSRKKSR